jgi:predicted transport protein
MSLYSLHDSTIQQQDNQNYTTFKKNIIFFDVIKKFSIKDKRKILSLLRLSEINVDTLFPNYGITAGEFCTWIMLSGNSRKKNCL